MLRAAGLMLLIALAACAAESPNNPGADAEPLRAADATAGDAELSRDAIAATDGLVSSDGSGAIDAEANDAADDAGGGAPDAGSTSDGSTDAATIADAAAPDAGSRDVGPLGMYASNGPQAFTTMTVPIMIGRRTFDEQIWLPSTPGLHPVVLFSPGTQQPASSYVPYFERLASYGFIVLANDDPGPLTNTSVVVDLLVHLATVWLPAQNQDATSPFFGRVDLSRIGLTGHSRGGKATLIAAETSLNGIARAYFGIDMIDVTFIDDRIYASTNIARVGIPTVFLVAGVPSNCSPTNANGEVLYRAAPSPSVLITGIGAGHMDFETRCVFCSACTPGGTADPDVVFEYSLRYVTAFFARELLDDATVGASFSGAGALSDVTRGSVRIESK